MKGDPVVQFPTGWVQAVFGDICAIRNGYAFKSKNFIRSGAPLIKQGNLTGSQIDLSNCAFLPVKFIEEHPNFQVTKGDILIGMSGSLGKPSEYRENELALQNQRTGLLCPTPEGNRAFARYFLDYSHFELVDKSKGMAIQNVSAKDIEAIPLGVPPLNEQRRIADKIETLFARLDKGEEGLRRVQALLARYRKSVLKAAVTGRLTAGWRAENAHRLESGETLLARILETCRKTWSGRGKYKEPATPDTTDLPELPEGWVWATVDMLGEVVTGGTPPTAKKDLYYGGEVPFLKPTDLDQGYSVDSSRETLTLAGAEKSRTVPFGSVLVTSIGATTGKTGLNHCETAAFNQQINAIVPMRGIAEGEFVFWSIVESGFQTQIWENAAATTLPIINKSKFSRLLLPLPSIMEQRVISDLLIGFEERISHLEDWCQTELARSVSLRQSILKEAFAGRLVPQDPGDEPAADLLARIKATRADAPKKRSPRKARA